jgi:[ribosomal protein S5]-alanine N-acetyltransferase
VLDLTAAFESFPTLETERLVLRAPRAEDAPDIFRIMSDERVVRYFGTPPMRSPEQALRRVESFQSDFAAHLGVRWAITMRDEGRLIGTLGFWRLVKEHLRAEIGYELAPERWGQGIMPEALEAVLQFGFTAMGLHSVEAQIEPPNAGSRRVLEKLGFVQEGYFRENYYHPEEGRFSDTAVFSLLNRS